MLLSVDTHLLPTVDTQQSTPAQNNGNRSPEDLIIYYFMLLVTYWSTKRHIEAQRAIFYFISKITVLKCAILATYTVDNKSENEQVVSIYINLSIVLYIIETDKQWDKVTVLCISACIISTFAALNSEYWILSLHY